MAKRRSLEDQLAAIAALRDDPNAPEAVAQLREGLRAKSHHVVAKAAKVVGEGEVAELADELVAAFERWKANGGGADKGCGAKTAIAEALYRINPNSDGCERVFLAGVGHVQREPVYGGSVDVAAELRGHCAMGLVRMNHFGVMLRLADLLADAEPPARAAAARAMAYRGGEDALPLLRYKATVGDENAEVLSECLLAMLQLSPGESLAFVTGMLGHRDASRQEAAGLALGQSRLAEALPPLQAWLEKSLDRELRRTAMTAMALLRTDASLAYLVELVATEDPQTALDAAATLAMYRHDPALRERAEEAARRRRDARFLDEVRRTMQP